MKDPIERLEEIKTIIAQKAVIKSGNKFLILKRATDEKVFPNLWDFPGGKIEEKEDPIESVAREVKEETSLDIKPGNIQGTYESSIGNSLVKFVIYSCKVTSVHENVSIGSEHSEYRWATVDEIRILDTMPYMNEYLSFYF